LPVFISYSHSDKDFVDSLAGQLMLRNAHVWVDRWELNVGDSILNNVQSAIQDASALIVVLSKASVQSEWCKKELSAGLMRELDERRVVVLPAVLEDCEVPVFLREKMYADFRKNFDVGLGLLVDAIAKVTTSDQGRTQEPDGTTDWSVDWGFHDGLVELLFTIVDASKSTPITVLTEVTVTGNEVVTARYKKFAEAGLGWMGRLILTEALVDIAEADTLGLILENPRVQVLNRGLRDPKRNAEYRVSIRCRRLGEDNGKDQFINVSNYLVGIRDWMRHVSRKPTREESVAFREIIATPW
jgi:TIR domain